MDRVPKNSIAHPEMLMDHEIPYAARTTSPIILSFSKGCNASGVTRSTLQPRISERDARNLAISNKPTRASSLNSTRMSISLAGPASSRATDPKRYNALTRKSFKSNFIAGENFHGFLSGHRRFPSTRMDGRWVCSHNTGSLSISMPAIAASSDTLPVFRKFSPTSAVVTFFDEFCPAFVD